MHYVTAGPSQYVVVTGLGVEDLRIVRKGWVWPFQKTVMLDVAPLNFTLGKSFGRSVFIVTSSTLIDIQSLLISDLQAMSNEKLEFNLPAVFTIGPKDDVSSLNKYARLLGGKKDNKHVEATVKGIIEGETRVIAAGMTMVSLLRCFHEIWAMSHLHYRRKSSKKANSLRSKSLSMCRRNLNNSA